MYNEYSHVDDTIPWKNMLILNHSSVLSLRIFQQITEVMAVFSYFAVIFV